jgi:hypothetical protein
MKHLLTATCIAATCAVGLSAQQPPASTTTAQQGQARARTMTLTGCIEAGKDANTFVLTHVSGLRGETGVTGTSGSATTTASPATTTAPSGEAAQGGMNEVMLKPAADLDLSKHLGHKVELTGTFSGRRNMGASSSATPEPGQPAATTGASSGQARTMTVSSLKMVSDSCSAK